MAEYAIAPMTEPTWKLDPQEFADRLHEHWPDAKIGVNDLAGSKMVVHALIPLDGPRELGIALSETGQYVSLDPADPESAAGFALWFLHLVPDPNPPLNIFPKDGWRPFEIKDTTTEAEIVEHLSQPS